MTVYLTTRFVVVAHLSFVCTSIWGYSISINLDRSLHESHLVVGPCHAKSSYSLENQATAC